jgi:hypothetical protein
MSYDQFIDVHSQAKLGTSTGRLGPYMSSSGPTLGSQAQLHIHTHMGHDPGRDIPPTPALSISLSSSC